jgi:hypothetical protein
VKHGFSGRKETEQLIIILISVLMKNPTKEINLASTKQLFFWSMEGGRGIN